MSTSRRRGNTLIEVTAAAMVIATALVPALRLMRDGLAVSREVELADVMATFASSRMEESIARTCAAWNTTTETGDYSSQGYANLKYQVTKSDDPLSGGVSNRLMAITTTVWDDKDSDNSQDTGEPRVRFSTKLARFVSYDYEASGM